MKKKMNSIAKKLIGLVLIAACVVSVAGCGKKNQEVINVAVLKGPTAIGMVNLMSEDAKRAPNSRYQFTVAGAADEITGKLISNEINIAAVPSNLAATLYNKTEGKIQICAVNTLGVLYIVENGDTIKSVADLKGKTIYSTGKGTTPEYTLRALLTQAGIDPDKDVTIEFKSEATEVAALLTKTEESAIAMLPQPYVTSVMLQNKSVRIALDVTKEWEKVFSDSSVITGVLVVNKDWADAHKSELKSFLDSYKKSAETATKDVEATANLLEEFGIFKAAVGMKAIPYCNVVYMDGKEMKEKVTAYLKTLFDQNPKAVGGKMPDEGLFR